MGLSALITPQRAERVRELTLIPTNQPTFLYWLPGHGTNISVLAPRTWALSPLPLCSFANAGSYCTCLSDQGQRSSPAAEGPHGAFTLIEGGRGIIRWNTLRLIKTQTPVGVDGLPSSGASSSVPGFYDACQ